MDNNIEKFDVNGLQVEIFQDDATESPDAWEDPTSGVFLVTTKNRYFEVIPEGYSVEEIAEHMETHELYHNHKVFPLFAYIHSGVALSLGRYGQFSDPWDSGQIGFVLVKRGTSKDLYKTAESLVETWNQYLSGDVYGFTITDSRGDVLESVWGFYGFDYCKNEAIAIAKNLKVTENCQLELFCET